MKKITAKWLEENQACQLEMFKKHWPKGGEISLANLKKAASQGFDLNWLALRILTAPALAEYEKVKAPALDEYKKVTAPAWAEYEKATAPALAEYEKVRAPALAEYEKVTALAWAEYQKVTAPALWQAWKTQEGAASKRKSAVKVKKAVKK